MKYYEFSHSTELSEIGDFPQCEISRKINPRAPDGIYNLKHNEFPNFTPKIELVLLSKAKWTDVMLSGGMGHRLLVSQKAKNILERHKLPSSAFYQAKIHSGKSSRDYFWFHFINPDFWDWVDREESKLCLRSILPDEKDKIIEEVNLDNDIEGFMAMTRAKPRLTDYYWERLVFNENFPNLDFFRTLLPSMHTLISQRLKDVFENAEITGYETKDFCVHEKY
nr:DUF1629 domain-containing protein [Allomuricauda sp.]